MAGRPSLCSIGFIVFFLPVAAAASDDAATGTLRGKITVEATGDPLHHATVRITQLRRSTETNDEGVYELTGLPVGTYEVVAHMHALANETRSIQIKANETTVAHFALKLATMHAEVTVTASGQEQTSLESFQAVSTLETLDLASKGAASLGEVLEDQPGVAKRSFGPGTARPVIRGFDGDRVLVLQDGVRTGTLSSQSGDHGEPIDPTTLDRLEVVKGPATLLYGSSALGGVVNTITGHHQIHKHPHEGLRGYLTGSGGSANGQAGASGGFEYGVRNWLIWGDGANQRTGDYSTPIGRIPNSKTRLTSTLGGFGRYKDKTFFNLSYGLQDGRYGVPFASELGGEGSEPIDLDFRRHNLRFNGGFQNLGSFVDEFDLALNYTDWNHRELEGDIIGTQFFNRQFVYRGVFDQLATAKKSGSFGFWGMRRDYKALGQEALTPPVIQDAFAFFGLQELRFERFRLQAGGRLEHNRYDPTGLEGRSFTGFSGALGINLPLWPGGAFVTNYTHSYRAPALEELYANGPHVGNLTFEVGNPRLERERSNGLDFSVRHQASRIHAEADFFYYLIENFVYLAPTGQIRDNLIEAEYFQSGTRYRGAEARTDFALHPSLWLNLGVDAVNAQLRKTHVPLPRIPPIRGRIGLDARHKGFSVRPELVLANDQSRFFPTETPTPGYALVNLAASYTLARQHVMHVFSANLFNATNQLYRNHLSFIKDLAPEIGRGLRFTYTARLF